MSDDSDDSNDDSIRRYESISGISINGMTKQMGDVLSKDIESIKSTLGEVLETRLNLAANESDLDISEGEGSNDGVSEDEEQEKILHDLLQKYEKEVLAEQEANPKELIKKIRKLKKENDILKEDLAAATNTNYNVYFFKYVFSYDAKKGATLTPDRIAVVDNYKSRLEFDIRWRYVDTEIQTVGHLETIAKDLEELSKKVITNSTLFKFKNYLHNFLPVFRKRVTECFGMYIFQTAGAYTYKLCPIVYDELQAVTDYDYCDYSMSTVPRYEVVKKKHQYYILDLQEYKVRGQRIYPSDAEMGITISTYKEQYSIYKFKGDRKSEMPNEVYTNSNSSREILYTTTQDGIANPEDMYVRRVSITNEITGIQTLNYILLNDYEQDDTEKDTEEFNYISEMIRDDVKPIKEKFEEVIRLKTTKTPTYSTPFLMQNSQQDLMQLINTNLFKREMNDVFQTGRDLGKLMAKLYIFCGWYDIYYKQYKNDDGFEINFSTPKWFQKIKNQFLIELLTSKIYTETIVWFKSYIKEVTCTTFKQMWCVLINMNQRDRVTIDNNITMLTQKNNNKIIRSYTFYYDYYHSIKVDGRLTNTAVNSEQPPPPVESTEERQEVAAAPPMTPKTPANTGKKGKKGRNKDYILQRLAPTNQKGMRESPRPGGRKTRNSNKQRP